MVSISTEQPDETEHRLRQVFQASQLKQFDGLWSFYESSRTEFPACLRPNALAVILDDDTCSQLVPYSSESSPMAECFKLMRFHFADTGDNSGFVGWLASLIKQRTGAGVFVVCGSNKKRGGIYDYWGYPEQAEPGIVLLFNELRKELPTIAQSSSAPPDGSPDIASTA